MGQFLLAQAGQNDLALRVQSIYNKQVKNHIEGEIQSLQLTHQKTAQTVQQAVLKVKEVLPSEIQGGDGEIVSSVRALHQSFHKNLGSYKNRANELEQRISRYDNREEGAVPPDFNDRRELKKLTSLIARMEKSKWELIGDTLQQKLSLEINQNFIKTRLITGDGDQNSGLLRSGSVTSLSILKPKTMKAKEDRAAFLVVGGAASGKGSITDGIKLSRHNDLLELNPDLYKRVLLDANTLNDVKMHAAITHQESSIIYDRIVSEWQDLASSDKAPDVLSDVLRASNWMINTLSAGDTSLQIHTPVLNIVKALDRAFKRGESTGRFVPTVSVIEGHQQQVKINKGAIAKRLEFNFYNTDLPKGKDLGLSGFYDPESNQLHIYDLPVMLDYFSKDTLSVYASEEEELSEASYQKVIASMLSYCEVVEDIKIYAGNKNNLIATLGKSNLSLEPSFLEEIPNEAAEYFLKGCLENDVNTECHDPQSESTLNQLRLGIEQEKANQTVNIHDYQINKDQYVKLLCDFVDNGRVYVRKPRAWKIYSFPADLNEFEKTFPYGVQILKKKAESGQIIEAQEYSPTEQAMRMLTFDSRRFRTNEDCLRVIQQLKQTGRYEGSGISLSDHVKDNFYLAENHEVDEGIGGSLGDWLPNPQSKVVAMKNNTDENMYLVSKSGKSRVVPPSDWIKASISDFSNLEKQVYLYRKNPEKYSSNLMLAGEGKVYRSGPGNIDGGYSYALSQEKIRNLVSSLSEASLFKEQNGNRYFYAAQVDHFIPLSSTVGAEPGQWVVVEASLITSLQRTLNSDELDQNDYSNLLTVWDSTSVQLRLKEAMV